LHETWSVSLREECGVRVLENRVLKKKNIMELWGGGQKITGLRELFNFLLNQILIL
jgi:hypothetical protein